MKEPKEESKVSNETGPGAQHHPDGALDDPLHDWWQKNGRSLVTGAILAIVATAAVFGFRAYRKGQVEDLQQAYNQAVVADDLASFAINHSGHPLAGLAALRTANVAFESDDWGQALEYYTVAVDSLTDNPLHGKARLGLGATRMKMGETEEAARVFEALANDEKAFPAARSEAMYFLALNALSQGDQEGFEKWSESLAGLDPMAVWQNRLRYYRERVSIPVVDAPVEASVEAPEDNGEEEPAGAQAETPDSGEGSD